MSATTPPIPGTPQPFLMPAVVAARLDNELELRVVERPASPLVSVELVLDAGEGGIPRDQAGLAVLTAAALDGGTRRRSGGEMARALEQLGCGVSGSAGWDDFTLAFSALPDRFDAVLELLAERILEPAFPDDEVARVRDQRLAAIEQRRSDPSMLATVAIHSEIFASRVPYSRPLAGTQESVSSFDSSSLRGYAEARIRPLGGGMAVAGPIPAESVEASVARVFGGWTGAPEVTSEVEAAPRHPGPGVLILDRPGAVQSEIRLGHVGIERASPDYFPLRVFNGVLGGTFTSRLNLNLRERNGFTYGVRSSFRARRGRGPFTVATGVGTEHTVDAVREAFSEIRHLLDGGPSPDEIEAVKDYLVGVFPLTVETTGQLAGRLGELFPYGLPDDYHARWRDQISGVSAAGAHEAGRRNLRPGDLRVVVVGDSGAMRSGLEALGLGSVETIPAAEWDPQP